MCGGGYSHKHGCGYANGGGHGAAGAANIIIVALTK